MNGFSSTAQWSLFSDVCFVRRIHFFLIWFFFWLVLFLAVHVITGVTQIMIIKTYLNCFRGGRTFQPKLHFVRYFTVLFFFRTLLSCSVSECALLIFTKTMKNVSDFSPKLSFFALAE